eukprot:5002688-Prymnesium_polylepis.2
MVTSELSAYSAPPSAEPLVDEALQCSTRVATSVAFVSRSSTPRPPPRAGPAVVETLQWSTR